LFLILIEPFQPCSLNSAAKVKRLYEKVNLLIIENQQIRFFLDLNQNKKQSDGCFSRKYHFGQLLSLD